MTKTKNYSLNQWDAHDPIRRTDFNADNAAIDAALAANAKALSDYQTANDTAVGKKADTTALAALEQSVQTLRAAVGSGGQTCRVAWGSYTGTGGSGKNAPCTLSFDFTPVAVWVAEGNGSLPAMTMLRGSTNAVGIQVTTGLMTPSTLSTTWNGNSLSWYSSSSATAQYNYSGTYYYVAIGYSAE